MNTPRLQVLLRPCAVALILCCALAPAMRGQSSRAPQNERDSATAGAQYVGSEVCAQCHTAEATAQATTAMAHALSRPVDSIILQQHPVLAFRNGPYQYRISQQGSGAAYSVSDGRRVITIPILWAVGQGAEGVGQTYLFRYGGFYFESQVSFYQALGGLDITIGHITYPPDSIGAALGYPLKPKTVRECFACHATGAVRNGRLDTGSMTPGVSCEACHGPGSRHVRAVKSGALAHLDIFNPGRLSTGGITNFCGSCHRTAAQEKVLRIRGVENVRFQPYRLQKSRCYNPRDPRISCLACHDPHRPVVRAATYYDSKCLSCHALKGSSPAAGKRSAPACPVATRSCTSCHMLRIEVPAAHYKFTDHFIRIVMTRQAYPN